MYINGIGNCVSWLHQHRKTCQLHLSRPRGGHKAQLRGVTSQYFLMATYRMQIRKYTNPSNHATQVEEKNSGQYYSLLKSSAEHALNFTPSIKKKKIYNIYIYIYIHVVWTA